MIVAPKLLFYCIEQCQEIMTLGMLPYMMEQVILLMALQIFPLREFDMWKIQQLKCIWPSRSPFMRHILVTST